MRCLLVAWNAALNLQFLKVLPRLQFLLGPFRACLAHPSCSQPAADDLLLLADDLLPVLEGGGTLADCRRRRRRLGRCAKSDCRGGDKEACPTHVHPPLIRINATILEFVPID